MIFSHKMLAVSALLLSLLLPHSSDLRAQDENPDAPIIALANNNIYAVSPSDGESRLLVERSKEKDEQLDELYYTYKVNFLLSSIGLSPISPDNTKFAYKSPVYEQLDPEFEDKRIDIARMNPNDITLVDIASGEQTPITEQGVNFKEMFAKDKLTNFSDLTWSPDGQRLYFLALVRSRRPNRVPQRTLEYYDLAAGERRTLARFDAEVYIADVVAVPQGLVIVSGPQEDFKFTLYSPDGTLANAIEMTLPGYMGCTNEVMVYMNPVFNNGGLHYGYYVYDTDENLPFLLDVASESSIPLEANLWPGLMAHGHSDTSLRLVFSDPCYEQKDHHWSVTDAKGRVIDSMFIPHVGINFNQQITLSPDGASMAMLLSETTIRIMDTNGSRELDFAANSILWGAYDFTFTPVIKSD